VWPQVVECFRPPAIGGGASVVEAEADAIGSVAADYDPAADFACQMVSILERAEDASFGDRRVRGVLGGEIAETAGFLGVSAGAVGGPASLVGALGTI
jgi:hypothetical protein